MNKTTKNTGNTAPAQSAPKKAEQTTAPSNIYKMGLEAAEKREKAIKDVLEDMQNINNLTGNPFRLNAKMRPITDAYFSALQDMVDRTLDKPHNKDIDELELDADALYDLHDRASYLRPEFSEQDVDRMTYNILKRIIAIAISRIESVKDFIKFADEITSIKDLTYKELLNTPEYQAVKEIENI